MQIVDIVVAVVGACNEPKVKFNSLIMGQHLHREGWGGGGIAAHCLELILQCCRAWKYAMQLMCSAVCPGCPLSSAPPTAQTIEIPHPPLSLLLKPLLLRCLPLKRHAQCILHAISLPRPTRHSCHSCHNCHNWHMPQQSMPRRILGKPQLLRAHDFSFSSSSSSSSTSSSSSCSVV